MKEQFQGFHFYFSFQASLSDRCGALHVGDLLLAVSGVNVAQLELERVTDLIRGDPTMGKYSFTLNHQKENFKEGEGYNNKEHSFKNCVISRLAFAGPMSTPKCSKLSKQYVAICSHARNNWQNTFSCLQPKQPFINFILCS